MYNTWCLAEIPQRPAEIKAVAVARFPFMSFRLVRINLLWVFGMFSNTVVSPYET